jgi:DNA-binding HxlR family transcriptional regulator
MTRKQRHQSYAKCPVEAGLDLIGGKWKAMILLHLFERPHRFNELRRTLPSITQRMLTNQLRELEADGLVHRELFPEVPPRVEYSLTPFGRSLDAVITALRAWGETHVAQRMPAAE